MADSDNRDMKTTLVHVPSDTLVLHNITPEDIPDLEKVAYIAFTTLTSRRGN